jgi:signal transduction histidine kinase/HAMP domain-containing protein
MKLRTKILLAEAPLALGLALVGLVALDAFQALGRSSGRILQDNFRSVLAAQRMKDAAERLDRAAVARLARTGAPPEAQAAALIAEFELQLPVQEGNITESGEADATRRLRAAWSAYRGAWQASARADGETELRRRYLEELQPGFLRLQESADRILAINQEAMLRKSEQAQATAERSRSLLVLSTLAATALCVLASLILTRRALRPLGRLSGAVRRIGEGDLDARAGLQGEDEIAAVGRELDTMADKLRDYRNSSLGELLQAQQALQTAIDSLPDPILVLGTTGQLLNVNESGERLLHVVAGADPFSSLDPDLRAAIEKVRVQVISGGAPYVPAGLEEALRVGDRKLLPRATPLYSERGRVAGATLVLQDVTRLVRFDELKNDLVATVAHEVRTPLTSLRMALHMVLDGTVGPLGARQSDLLRAAREDCERLQGIVEDLLDLSRIQAGKVEVRPEPIASKALVDRALANGAALASAAGIRLVAAVPEGATVLADAARIVLVLDNLIANAVRHSPRDAQVTVRARLRGDSVQFEVEDVGAGIAPEHRHHIFEKFFRVPGTKGEGVGLGLYLSREIVLAHGGEMGLASDAGVGSRFWFTLRTAGDAQPTASAA